MAKAVAHCICRECKREFEKTRICRSRSEADSWKRWAEDNINQCYSCYKKSEREKEKQKGLYVDVRLDIYGGEGCDIAFVFGGDTYPHKEAIKMIGGKYLDDYPQGGGLESLFAFRRPEMRWVIYCSIDDFEHTLELVKSTGATINSLPESVDIAIFHETRRALAKRKEEE